jgi:hypothetical protein
MRWHWLREDGEQHCFVLAQKGKYLVRHGTLRRIVGQTVTVNGQPDVTRTEQVKHLNRSHSSILL